MRRDIPVEGLPPIEAGQRYERLLAIEYVAGSSWKKTWRFRCDCGNEKVIRVAGVRSGDTKSCGCRRVDVTIAKNTTHGKCHSDEYHAWQSMIARCTNSTRSDYSRYGGRGIIVCARWIDGFEAFFSDMGPRPSPQHSLDRKDNMRGYEPGNVRWATAKEQARNRRSNRTIEYNGIEMTLAEAVERSELKYGTVLHRLKKGWSIDQALSAPVRTVPVTSLQ